jgi:hypothetical protein
MPVKKGFTESDFLQLNGQRFLQDTTNGIQAILSQGYSYNGNPYFNNPAGFSAIGPAGIYFTQINRTGVDTAAQFQFSGLFEGTLYNGNSGDTLHVTRGRFDFLVPASGLNF